MELIDKEKLINEMNARDENIELPKHTNPLPLTVDDRVKLCKKVDVIPIPEGATNGDMMKAVFPNESTFNGGEGVGFKKEWWNAPYKRESEE